MTVRRKARPRSVKSKHTEEKPSQARAQNGEVADSVSTLPRNFKRRLKTHALRSLPRAFDPTDDELVRLFLRNMLDNIAQGKISDYTYTHPLSNTMRDELEELCRQNKLHLDQVPAKQRKAIQVFWRISILKGSPQWTLYALKHERQEPRTVVLRAADQEQLLNFKQMSTRMGLRILHESTTDLELTLASPVPMSKPVSAPLSVDAVTSPRFGGVSEQEEEEDDSQVADEETSEISAADFTAVGVESGSSAATVASSVLLEGILEPEVPEVYEPLLVKESPSDLAEDHHNEMNDEEEADESGDQQMTTTSGPSPIARDSHLTRARSNTIYLASETAETLPEQLSEPQTPAGWRAFFARTLMRLCGYGFSDYLNPC